MPWWAWLGFGLLSILLELLTSLGFYLIFFGVGALVVGALASLPWVIPPWAEWLLFTGCSIVALLLFRRPVLARFHASGQRLKLECLVGETALVLEDIAVGSIGRVELQGTTWNARNFGAHPLSRGQRCMVEKSAGLLLGVRGS
jgi:hypothetical protein